MRLLICHRVVYFGNLRQVHDCRIVFIVYGHLRDVDWIVQGELVVLVLVDGRGGLPGLRRVAPPFVDLVAEEAAIVVVLVVFVLQRVLVIVLVLGERAYLRESRTFELVLAALRQVRLLADIMLVLPLVQSLIKVLGASVNLSI